MRKSYIFPLMAALIALSGCNAAGTSSDSLSSQTSETASDKTSTSEESAAQNAAQTLNLSDMFTNNDIEIGYDEETSARITLSGDTAVCGSDAVEISGGNVTIKDEGTYILSGELNGMIIVNAEKTDKVRLVLNGANITSSTSAALYVAQADKVFVTTVSGSENTLTNGGEYVAIDDNNIDAVIYSKDDLTLNGAGTLNINAAAGHGVVSKDDLTLTSGAYNITAASHGLSGKDSVRISNGTYTIKSEKDGIQAENSDDAEKGFVYISGGSFDITAKGDGISSSAYLTIEDGDFDITTGDGSESVTMPTETFGPRGGFGEKTTASDTTDTVSRKGIKTDGTLTVSGGSFKTDTEDDSFHAGGNISINGGSFDIKTGDDAVHSDADATIKNGKFNISYCYEGIEGQTITVEDGEFDIDAHDDGLNAAGGADSSGFGGGFPGDRFSSSSDCSITINGGTFVIVSDGDCIDSNGALTINGGKLDLTCNGNGNTALDCDGTYSNNGGDITTNDGSESNPGQMGGGMGHDGMGNGGMQRPGGIGGMERPNDMEGNFNPGGMGRR